VVLFSALFLLSVLITLVVLSGRRPAVGSPAAETEGEPAPSVEQIIAEFTGTGSGPVAATGSGGIVSVQDFVLPEVVQEDAGAPYLLRPRMNRWQQEQIQRYWIPLEEVALDIVVKENDRRIEKLFEDIP
jgi:hypothetical protein